MKISDLLYPTVAIFNNGHKLESEFAITVTETKGISYEPPKFI